MHKILLLLASVSILSACATPKPEAITPFCAEQGGKNAIQKDNLNHEYGVCVLENGFEVNDWEYYQMIHPEMVVAESKCDIKEARKVVGKSNLTDEQIQSITKASIVRRTQSFKPVSLEFRGDRVTVVTNNKNKILKAICG